MGGLCSGSSSLSNARPAKSSRLRTVPCRPCLPDVAFIDPAPRDPALAMDALASRWYKLPRGGLLAAVDPPV